MRTIRNHIGIPFVIALVLGISMVKPVAYGQETQQEKSYSSKFPKFSFPTTLSEQEKALSDNPMLQWFKESRDSLSNDPHRPVYHFVSPRGDMNDPNGFCFWNGNWHLFYQSHMPKDPRAHWGHAISKDLVHWRDLPLAIYPNPEQQSFSGGALVEEDRVIAMYDGTLAGNMVAISKDPLLLNWDKLTGKPVIPFDDNLPIPPRHRTRVGDPFLWKMGDNYYAIIGHMKKYGSNTTNVRADNYDFYSDETHVRANYLFESADLKKWTYLHPFVEGDRFSMVGDDGSCPYFLPIGDRYILLFFSHKSGSQYLLGDYDKESNTFNVTSHGWFNHGAVRPGGVHAPSAASDGNEGILAFFNMNPARPTEGWNQLMTLPMHLTLRDDDKLNYEPAGAIESLRYHHQAVEPMTLPANEEVVFENIKGNAMEILTEIDPGNAQHVELNVLRSPDKKEYTRISFYKNRLYNSSRGYNGNSVLVIETSNSSVLSDVQSRPPEKAYLNLQNNETITLRVFIDKSVVEVYSNGKQYAAVRVYPGMEESTGVSIQSRGQDSKLISLNAWQMKNIWEVPVEDWKTTPLWR